MQLLLFIEKHKVVCKKKYTKISPTTFFPIDFILNSGAVIKIIDSQVMIIFDTQKYTHHWILTCVVREGVLRQAVT